MPLVSSCVERASVEKKWSVPNVEPRHSRGQIRDRRGLIEWRGIQVVEGSRFKKQETVAVVANG